jgi:hypothetical protein
MLSDIHVWTETERQVKWQRLSSALRRLKMTWGQHRHSWRRAETGEFCEERSKVCFYLYETILMPFLYKDVKNYFFLMSRE